MARARRSTKTPNRRKTASRSRRAVPSTARGKRGRPAADRARVILLVGTRKGAWLYHGDASRGQWRSDGPHLLGQIVNHLVLDPRDQRTLLMASKTGHLGPTIFRSVDMGRTWQEATRPP